MSKRFVIKKRQERKPSVPLRSPAPVSKLRADEGDDNAVKDNKNMDIKEKAAKIEEIMQNPEANPGRVKRVKKDKGLIERTESSKVVLTEDNKQLLND